MGKINQKTSFFLFILAISLLYSPLLPVIADSIVKNPGTYIYEKSYGFSEPLDPATNYESFGGGINELVYETLVTYKGNSASEFEGNLATSWDIDANHTTYTFHLHQGVTFHDGVEFNAYVMKYSLDRAIIMNDRWGPAWMLQEVIRGGPTYMEHADNNLTEAYQYLNAAGITVIDAFTLEINLLEPFAPFISLLAQPVTSAVSPLAVITHRPASYRTDDDDLFGMVSLAAWFGPGFDPTKLGLPADHDLKISGVVPDSGADSDAAHQWMADHGVGTGPYKLVEVNPGENITLQKHSDWWKTFSPGAVDKVILKTVPDEATRILDLKAGNADEADISKFSLHANEIVDSSGNVINETLAVYVGKTFSNLFLGMNLNDSLEKEFIDEDPASTYDPSKLAKYAWGTENASSNPFTSLLFRKAIAMSFDYETFMDFYVGPYAERLEGLIPNDMFGHVEDLIETGFIPTFDSETAKSLFNQVGWKGTITLVARGIQAAVFLKNVIEAMDIGITINVEEGNYPSYLDALRARKLPIYYLGWSADYSDPHNFVYNILHSEKSTYTPLIHYSNPELDQKIDLAAKESDPNIRETIYREIEQMVASDVPLMYIYQNHRFIVTRSWLVNYVESGSLNPMSRLFNAEYITKLGGATQASFSFSISLTLAFCIVLIFYKKKRKG
ncbi:MAG: ABC transporter substrate-binding protein [Candidatus Hermodarchaeota archaeon]